MTAGNLIQILKTVPKETKLMIESFNSEHIFEPELIELSEVIRMEIEETKTNKRINIIALVSKQNDMRFLLN